MLFHEAGDDAVLALQPGFEGVDPFLAFLLGAGSVTAVLLEGAVAVLEEFLLPEVEGVDADVQFVTDLRDRHVVEQVPLDGRHFLLGGTVRSRRFGHGRYLRPGFLTRPTVVVHFRLKQDSLADHHLLHEVCACQHASI
jgi:hypothetical protein